MDWEGAGRERRRQGPLRGKEVGTLSKHGGHTESFHQPTFAWALIA